MDTRTLLPAPRLLHLEKIVPTEKALTLVVQAVQPAAPCPLCGHTSGRVHSRYERTVADLPWQGIAVRLKLTARRFFCDTPRWTCCPTGRRAHWPPG